MSKDVTQKDSTIKNTLPTVADVKDVARKPQAKSKKNTTAKSTAPKNKKYTVEVPLGGNGREGYASYVIKQDRLTPSASSKLKEILAGLIKAGAALTDGRKVNTKERAITWLLENLGK